MTRLVMHIGTHKTGTTTLQHVLCENAEMLRSRGIDFPLLSANPEFSPKNHSSLARSTTRAARGDVVPDQWMTVHDIVRRDAPDVVVLVGEQLCRLRPLAWQALRTTLERIGFDSVDVVCYVRRQDSYLTSMYVQWVKAGRSSSPFEEVWKAYSDHRFLRYDRLHEIVGNKLCPDRLSFRPFERSQFVRGSLLEDFLHTAGLDVELAELTGTDAALNESMGATSVRLLLLASAMANVMGVRGRKRRLAYREVRKVLPDHVPSDPKFVGWRNDQAERFLAGYEPHNRALARRLSGGDRLFTEEPARADNGSDEVHLGADAVERFTRDVRKILRAHA